MGVVATTTYGQLEGVEEGGVLHFRGIPFAAPPVGERRFRPPAPPVPWEGLRPAHAFGPVSPQNPSPMDAIIGVAPEPWDEDCLFLNVVTPALDDARRPVLVWIHGGGFIMGSGSSAMYDGATFARRGDAVYVSLNYRLGELGFLHLAHLDPSYAGSGNLGILDQVAALEWVRDNIAAFGGDPGNVTIFGESAGGMSVGTLLGVPRAQGLFHRAVAQSGACHNVTSAKHAEEITTDLLAKLGVRTVDELVALPVEQLLAARGDEVMAMAADIEGKLAGGGPFLPFQPVVDGDVLPVPPLEAVAAGAAAGVELLVGTTREEFKMFALMDMDPLDRAGLVARAQAVTGDGEGAVAVYEAVFPHHDPKALFGEMVTDHVFRMPAVRLVEAHLGAGGRAHMYLFSWPSKAMGGLLGSCHAIEVPFVFDAVDVPAAAMFLGDTGPSVHALADLVQDAWLAFARDGEPGHPGLPDWPAYDLDRRATMELDEQPALLEDPMGEQRRAWAALF